MNRGIRINPTVQQGGTGTIQQSTYLAHNNPCGINRLVFEQIGTIKITFLQLKLYLENILTTPEVQDLFLTVREKGTEYLYNPSLQSQLGYLYALMKWGQKATEYLPTLEVLRYRWRLSVYDENGVMIWDNFARRLEIVRDIGNGLYDWTYIPLKYEFTEKIPPPPLPPPPVYYKFFNPFIPPGKTTVQLYGLCNNTPYIGFLDRSKDLADRTARSSYLVNQAPLPEAMMAITSLLTDPANTRVFGFPRYGFSARQITFNSGLIGYNCVYLQEVNTLEKKPTTLENIYIRISLEQNNLTPIL